MTAPNTPVLDVAVLDELLASVQDDRSFVIQLIHTYLGDGERQLGEIQAAVTSGDADALVRPAHTRQSSSATVGAMRLAEMARSLELAARDGRTDDNDGSAAAIPAAWSVASDALRAWIDGAEA